MKVIALLVLSMAVVVCEQQTLFAPHYKYEIGPHLKAPNPTGRRNSLRPAARVNRLAPVNSSYAKAAPPKNGIFAGPIRLLDAGKGPTAGSLEHGPGLHDSLQPTPDPSMNLPEPTPVEPSAVRPIDNGCPACDFEILFGIGGSSDPGGDDV